jgi:hypothetical protein
MKRNLIKTHRCPYCSTEYTSAASTKRHMKSKHGDEDPTQEPIEVNEVSEQEADESDVEELMPPFGKPALPRL